MAPPISWHSASSDSRITIASASSWAASSARSSAPAPTRGSLRARVKQRAEVGLLLAGRLQPGVLLPQQHDLRLQDQGVPAGGVLRLGLRAHSTVTVFARLRGWSASSPRRRAMR